MKPARSISALNVLFRVAFICIGLSLPVWLYFAQLHPQLLLRMHEPEFRSLSAACDQAVRTRDAATNTRVHMTEDHISRLDRALEIGRLPCKRYAAFREHLLSRGVSQHALAALHLSASSDLTYPDLDNDLASTDGIDADLLVAGNLFALAPLPLKEHVTGPKFQLGEKLFHDQHLSGNTDRSCATCHRIELATADGAAVEPRLDVATELIAEAPPRNVPDLWNRDHNDVSAMLWDGRLEVTEAADLGGLVSPDGFSTTGFENLMALQSVRPIFIPAEMLGEPGPSNALSPTAHTMPQSEDVLARATLLLFAGDTVGPSNEDSYPALFQEAYGLKSAEEVRPYHLGNALAHFIEIEFQSRDTPWDRYLAGDLGALDEDQKRGALLFFGLGKCVVCHYGDVFSDFEFHSVGVPHVRGSKDLGRFYATGNDEDRFLFRTPPLRNVTLTAPYFHNGQAKSLIEAIEQHQEPYRFARAYAETGEHLMERSEVEAISPILGSRGLLNNEQFRLIARFLASLEDAGANPTRE